MLSSGGASVASTFTSYRHRPPPVFRLTITSTMARNGLSGSRETYETQVYCGTYKVLTTRYVSRNDALTEGGLVGVG